MGVVIALAVLIVVYLYMIMPRMQKRPDYTPLKSWHYAHRGLHDNQTEAPENSMAAFIKAVNAGYGIELDVQLTKDRIPVVFHDETLKRVCGVEGKVRDYTYAELQQFTLCDSNERIPLFADFLQMVDGRVPLIIEIKIHEKVDTVCSIADELIRNYKGDYCVESFHPLAVKWYKDHRPEVIRGQLSTNFRVSDKNQVWYVKLIHYLLTNILCRPDFIAYDWRFKNNISRRICCRLFGALSVAWTVRSQKTMDECKEDFDLFIFEGFIPHNNADADSSVQNWSGL